MVRFWVAGGGSEDTVFVYRVSEDTWEEAPRLNTARDAPGLGIIGEVSCDWWTAVTCYVPSCDWWTRVT